MSLPVVYHGFNVACQPQHRQRAMSHPLYYVVYPSYIVQPSAPPAESKNKREELPEDPFVDPEVFQQLKQSASQPDYFHDDFLDIPANSWHPNRKALRKLMKSKFTASQYVDESKHTRSEFLCYQNYLWVQRHYKHQLKEQQENLFFIHHLTEILKLLSKHHKFASYSNIYDCKMFQQRNGQIYWYAVGVNHLNEFYFIDSWLLDLEIEQQKNTQTNLLSKLKRILF